MNSEENFHENQTFEASLSRGISHFQGFRGPAKRQACCCYFNSNHIGEATMKSTLGLMLILVLFAAACTRASADVDPKALEQKYGLDGGYVEDITTETGKVQATIVP